MDQRQRQEQARRKFTGLIDSHQVPLIEFVYLDEYAEAQWRIWTNYNRDRTAGTYIVLHQDGAITRETLTPAGEVIAVGTVKPKEG